MRTTDGRLIILDGGTGIRALGEHLVEAARRAGTGISGDIFLTHAHWDHIQGLPFFAPFYERGSQFSIWSPALPGLILDQVLHDQMAPAVFPVAFDSLSALVDFCRIADGEQRVSDAFTVSAFAVQHPGGAFGYRFTGVSTQGSASFVYISDNEVRAADADSARAEWRGGLVEFIRGASLLVHDATYTADEYERHRGWGHSTLEDAVALALEAEVKELVLYHHAPGRSDDDLDQRLAECRLLVSRRGATLTVTAAAEGATVSV